jgi:transcription initiation factor TFIID TATA-box-binding protein
MQRLGYDAGLRSITIQNIVASCDVGFTIRLEGLALAQFHSATYEPELFPGLVFRMRSPQLVLLIFVSGKVVITGAKNAEDIEGAFRLIRPILKGTNIPDMSRTRTNK